MNNIHFRSSKKLLKQLQKKLKRGKIDPTKLEKFEMLLHSDFIKFCCYNDTQSVLGNTYGMCVLQVSTSV